VFMAFALITLVAEIVYFQMNSSLAVYLRDFHAISTQQFGFIISLNAGMVVALQFWFTRRISSYPPLLMMAVATIFYAVGFGMYGFVAGYELFLAAMVVITIGEMVAAPVGQSLVALFAPEDMRGRYMAVYALSFIVPTGIAPLLAGFILDNSDADMLWYLCLLLGLTAAAGFTLLHRYKAQADSAMPPIVPADVSV
jgi:MFS family permease